MTEPTVNLLKEAANISCANADDTIENKPIDDLLGNHHSKAFSTVPPSTNIDPNIRKVRDSLPVFQYREQILRAIEMNRVVVISGETGKKRKLFSNNKLLNY